MNPGADGVDANLFGREVEREAAGQAEHSGFRGGVGEHPGACHVGVDRGDVHDRAGAEPADVRQYVLDAQPRPLEVDREESVPLSLGQLGCITGRSDSRVVDQYLDRAAAVGGLVIAAATCSPSAMSHWTYRCPSPSVSAIGWPTTCPGCPERDALSGGGEFMPDREANALRAAGDDRDVHPATPPAWSSSSDRSLADEQ